jgi:hypothetical protein
MVSAFRRCLPLEIRLIVRVRTWILLRRFAVTLVDLAQTGEVLAFFDVVDIEFSNVFMNVRLIV